MMKWWKWRSPRGRCHLHQKYQSWLISKEDCGRCAWDEKECWWPIFIIEEHRRSSLDYDPSSTDSVPSHGLIMMIVWYLDRSYVYLYARKWGSTQIPALYGDVRRHLKVDYHYQDQIWDRISSSLDLGLTTRSLIYIDSNMTYSLGRCVPTQTRNVVSHDIYINNIQDIINNIWHKCKKRFYNVLNKYINPFLCDNICPTLDEILKITRCVWDFSFKVTSKYRG